MPGRPAEGSRQRGSAKRQESFDTPSIATKLSAAPKKKGQTRPGARNPRVADGNRNRGRKSGDVTRWSHGAKGSFGLFCSVFQTPKDPRPTIKRKCRTSRRDFPVLPHCSLSRERPARHTGRLGRYDDGHNTYMPRCSHPRQHGRSTEPGKIFANGMFPRDVALERISPSVSELWEAGW